MHSRTYEPANVSLVITGRVKPECRQEFLDLLIPLLDAMRHEPTFIDTVLHMDPEDPNRFMLYETWADLDELVQVQAQREYRKTFMDRLPELLAEERQIRIWKPLRGDFR
jgi:quinol monooxygenase YgiN